MLLSLLTSGFLIGKVIIIRVITWAGDEVEETIKIGIRLAKNKAVLFLFAPTSSTPTHFLYSNDSTYIPYPRTSFHERYGK